MKCAVGRADDAGIAHDTLFAHLWAQPDAVNGLPRPAVAAVDEPQSVRRGLVERCGDIHFLVLCNRSQHCRHHQEKDVETFFHVMCFIFY